jgi:ligand-binding sensor domain-containing protein/two-component sensor histidine kinase
MISLDAGYLKTAQICKPGVRVFRMSRGVKKPTLKFSALFIFVLGLSFVAQAERLPVKTYTIADGLAHDQIKRIVRDSRGFLWFCTQEGLSRFDGYKFTNYGTDEGLSSRIVTDFLETRSGDYWVATSSGLCRFNPKGRPANARDGGGSGSEPMFVAYFPDNERARWANDLCEDSAGNLWCATEGGLYRIELVDGQLSFRFVELGIKVRDQYDENIVIFTVIEGNQGEMWAGSQSGLFRLLPDGSVEHYTTAHGFIYQGVPQLFKDRQGRLWAGSSRLYRLVSDPHPDRPIVEHMFTKADGLLHEGVAALYQSLDGKLWAATSKGLARLDDDGKGGESFRVFTVANGLSSDIITALCEDGDGNIWAGARGAMKISHSGFVAYTNADGIKSELIYSIFKDQAGHLCLFGNLGTGKIIEWYDGKQFNSATPQVDRRLKGWGWGSHQNTFQDHLGEWWVATGEGLYRYPKVAVEQLAKTPPKAVYTMKDGLPPGDIHRLYEDSHGDIWIGILAATALVRWERTTETMHQYPTGTYVPIGTPTAFYEDREGNLWVALFTWSGLYPNGLLRYTSGQFKAFALQDGLPPGCIFRIYGDKSGRMWLATGQSGLVRVDEPLSDSPRFVQYATAQGLSSNQVLDVIEDPWGRLFLATGRGVDRLDVQSGRVRQYTTAEGLPGNGMYMAFHGQDEALWFVYFQGALARIAPEPDPPQAPPPVFISGLRIAGNAQRLSDLGETAFRVGELSATQNQVQIDFFGLSFAPGEMLRYQYKLEGSGEDWSEASDLRTANYPGLTPGTYRFLVRAVSADGTLSETPAAITFTILQPVWKRWWFVTLVALVLGLAAYAFYRYRVRRLVELERVRTRIATDLHDDIGSNLSLIAMASEVAKQQAAENPQMLDSLALVSRTSRQSVDAMSDIVWAVNPKRDHLHDLTERMRRFASDTFAAKDIEFEFVTPEGGQANIKLGTEIRRHVYLIFKESINNIAKHAACTEVKIDLQVNYRKLLLEISDNGNGFDPKQSSNGYGGNGLSSMQERAATIKGQVEIETQKGFGTVVRLKIPL